MNMNAMRKTPLILVVDDDASMRMLIRASLERTGFEVVEAENGVSAISDFKRLRPDAVLLDVMMPELDGFATCKEIRKLPEGEHTPVLMITGLEDIESIHRAFETGATDFVAKPINWVMLGYRVRYMLRASRTFHDLKKSQRQLDKAQHIARVGHWEMNLATRKILCSTAFCRIMDLHSSGEELAYETLFDPVHPDDKNEARAIIDEAVETKGPYSVNYRTVSAGGQERFIHNQGEVVFDEVHNQVFMMGIVQDITESKKAEEQIRYMAYYDDLTGLANRTLLSGRLEKALVDAGRTGKPGALLFLDLDRFKLINDSLGHHIGDQLLKGVAARIKNCVRGTDSAPHLEREEGGTCVSRLGGDEFTVLLTDLDLLQDAATVARRILDAIEKPMMLGVHEVFMTTSIGIGVFPCDGGDADTLLKNADAAMYDAKAKGRNNYQFYRESLNTATSERLELENDLRKALERNEFLLHYQPQLEFRTGEVIGAEALIRWKHPERGMIAPGNFIGIAEESGLIVPLSQWVLRAACEQNKAWQAAGLPPFRVAVNLSGAHFSQQSIVEMTSNALLESGLEARFLEVELTETALMDNKESARFILQGLKALGVTIAIDDFGTGYSSLAYLKSFPIDILKIDRSFVNDISTDPNDAAIVRAIVAMAHSLDLEVIAEGVETAEQLDFLRDLRCNHVQGFLFSRPIPAEDFAALIKKGSLAVAI